LNYAHNLKYSINGDCVQLISTNPVLFPVYKCDIVIKTQLHQSLVLIKGPNLKVL